MGLSGEPRHMVLFKNHFADQHERDESTSQHFSEVLISTHPLAFYLVNFFTELFITFINYIKIVL